MNGFRLDHLETFATVVELGSFSAAAERAGISQPAVSLQVRQFERQLGVRLIERVGKRAQPTAAGAELLIHARRIWEEVAAALASVAPHRDGAIGHVRIGTGATACIYLLPPILRRVKERLPGLEITVRTGNTGDMVKLVEGNAIDLALVTLPVRGRSLDITKAFEDELVAVFPASEPQPPGPVTPGLLAGKPMLFYEGGGNTRHIVDRWFAAAGHAPKPAMELGSVEAIKQLVGAGLGWSILPRLAISGTAGLGGIATASLRPRLVRSLGIVLRRDKHLGRGLREVLRSIHEARGD